MEQYKVVGNEQTIKDFFKDLGLFDLKSNESWLIETSFRTKKLTEDEKSLMKEHPKQSFKTKALKVNKKGEFDFNDSLNKLYELELPIRSCTYGTVSFPQSALVTYIAVNKTDETEVAIKHMKSVMELLSQNISSDNNDALKLLLAKTNKDWRSERATCVISNFVDFDIDFENITGYEVWANYSNKLIENIKDIFGENTIIVICNGGFHILTPKTFIKENPKNICKKLETVLSFIQIKEIDFKGTKTYVPLPGTYQYGADDKHIVQYMKIS